MAIIISSGMATSLATGVKSAELVSGANQYVGRGRIQLVAKQSVATATGIRGTLTVGGVPLMNDVYIPFSGVAGTLSANDNMVIDQTVGGGYVSFTTRNDAAGTVTFDHQLLFTPTK
jgi:hypothetical protein